MSLGPGDRTARSYQDFRGRQYLGTSYLSKIRVSIGPEFPLILHQDPPINKDTSSKSKRQAPRYHTFFSPQRIPDTVTKISIPFSARGYRKLKSSARRSGLERQDVSQGELPNLRYVVTRISACLAGQSTLGRQVGRNVASFRGRVSNVGSKHKADSSSRQDLMDRMRRPRACRV